MAGLSIIRSMQNISGACVHCMHGFAMAIQNLYLATHELKYYVIPQKEKTICNCNILGQRELLVLAAM